MESDNIMERIARLVLQANSELENRLKTQASPSGELACIDPAVGRWIDENNTEYLFSVLALDEQAFAETFPDSSEVTTQQRRQFMAEIESHVDVCLRCAEKLACDLEWEKRVNRALELNRSELRTHSDVRSKRTRSAASAQKYISKAKRLRTRSLKLSVSESPVEESAPKLFLSYSSEDKKIARQLASNLEYLGVPVWFDEWSLEPGDSLHKLIGQALETCRFVAVLLSPNSQYSKWFNKEVSQALSREDRTGKRVIIPLMRDLDHAPPFLEDRLHLRLDGHHYYRSLAEIVATVESLDRKLLAKGLESSLSTLGDVRVCLQAAGWKAIIVKDPKVFRSLMEFMGLPKSQRPDRFDIIARYGKTKNDDDDDVSPFRDMFMSC